MSQSLTASNGELVERADSGPGLPVWTLSACVVLSAAVVATGVYFAPKEFRIPLAIGGGLVAVALSIALSAAVHFRRVAVAARRAAAAVDADAEKRVAAVTVAAHARIAATNEAAGVHSSDAKNNENRRAAAMAAFAGAAGRMQAMTTSMLAELREMEHRHADPTVLADLLQLDHRTAQAGRLADSIAVLSGARSGRRWAKPIAMESILRGAMGRVAGYQRVRLRAVADIAIAGHAAEGVMHTLAELIDNACNFSPPTTEVHVYAAEVPAGVVITIEDSGLIMSESALRRAETAVSTNRNGRAAAPDLSSLSGTRLGLAVVGHLARKHGLTVSYRPSAIGGTAVVVVVPRDLTARIDRNRPSPAVTGGLPALTPPPKPPAAIGAELPKRRRGSTLAAVHPGGLSAAEDSAAAPPAARPSALGAFQRAVAGRDTDPSTPPAPSIAVENEP